VFDRFSMTCAESVADLVNRNAQRRIAFQLFSNGNDLLAQESLEIKKERRESNALDAAS